ncbi:cobaltochelatase subunit CobN, partial [Streptomyces iakyrus]
FYSVDPKAIPSRLSWEVGQSLADSLVQRYLQPRGRCREQLPDGTSKRSFELAHRRGHITAARRYRRNESGAHNQGSSDCAYHPSFAKALASISRSAASW